MQVIPTRTEAHGVSGPPQGQWTAADWERLPDDGNKYEIIAGVLYMSTSPSYFHNWVMRRLDRYIGSPAEDQGLGFAAVKRVGVFMPGVEPVQPDFLFVKIENRDIIRDRHIYGVPDLMIEVLSPGSRDYDEGIKLAAYAQAGVPEYAVIGLEQRQLRLYKLASGGTYGEPAVYNNDDTVTFDCLPTLPLQIVDLFSGAPDTTV